MEKEKKDVQTTLQRRVTDFESERNNLQAEKMSLQARICHMSEDLRHQRVDAQNQTFPFFPVQQVLTVLLLLLIGGNLTDSGTENS